MSLTWEEGANGGQLVSLPHLWMPFFILGCLVLLNTSRCVCSNLPVAE